MEYIWYIVAGLYTLIALIFAVSVFRLRNDNQKLPIWVLISILFGVFWWAVAGWYITDNIRGRVS